MNKKWLYIIIGIVILAVAAVLIFQPFSLNRGTPAISLPTPPGQSGDNPNSSLEVTADTVQTALRTLSRDSEFCHTYNAETFYGEESAKELVAYSKKGDKLLITRTRDGEVKNTLVADGNMYVWYDGSAEVYSSKAGSLVGTDEDRLARLITYEDLLSLPAEDITDAKYVTENSIACIYVKYDGDFGYTYELYVAVDSGLLTAARVSDGGRAVYALDTVSLTDSVSDDTFTPPST